ncbi:MAG: ATPase P, partial [Oscillospiraceae bacterium]|nr:ATPase P [Oscillospiraceae bacterium]
ELHLRHSVLDYNGTIAEDGKIIDEIAAQIEELSHSLEISVITADTHGTAARNCEGLPIAVKVYPTVEVGAIKAEEVRGKNGGVVCIGNGFNDILMSDAADLSICVIGREGCCGALLSHVDVVVTSIHDALDLLIQSDRLRATLRT